jgi:Bacterial Ig-like domain (group 2)
MNWQESRFLLVLAAVLGVIGLNSCGHEQQLVSITIQPDHEIFGATNIPVSLDAGLTVQARALGNFIHPPVSKDVTNQAVWKSNTPDIATVDAATGLVTATGLACGDALVTATVTTNHSIGNVSSNGAIVSGTMTATVVCPTAP